METKIMGSIYFNGAAMGPGFNCKGSSDISFGDAAPKKELQWVDVGNRLVADRCVCIGISWTTLNRLGFIFGHPVRIQGKYYLCRSLQMGSRESEAKKSEWGRLLKQTEHGDHLWHWKGTRFWGQDTAADNQRMRVVQGYYGAGAWGVKDKATEGWMVGFRPVLEPLAGIPEDLDTLVSKEIRVYGPDKGPFVGRLKSIDDYDLVLSVTGPVPRSCRWATKKGNTVIIGRNFVSWLGEI